MAHLRKSSRLKVLSTTEMNRRATAFVAKWKRETSENSASQSWWNDFFEIFGVDRYSTATFERWATRASTGNKGRIDVFMPGVMIAEHKSLGKDGGKAESQADDYLAGGDIPSHEMPRYIVSTDFGEVQITDLESPSDAPLRFPIEKLPKYISRFAFLSGYEAPKRSHAEQEVVSVKAARRMGELYDALLGDLDASADDHEAEQAAIFMTRLLFLMYGDDADGLWEADAFLNFIETCTVEDGSDTGPQIAQLFQVLDTPPDRRSPKLDDHLKVMPYVNGGLFKTRVDIPTFDKPMRDALLVAMNVEWGEVSPAIFGSLFQGLSSRERRREQGEHYTTEVNILKTLRPLFLDEMEAKLQAAWPSEAALTALHNSLAAMRYLDPACGCGNFLIVAYREMRDLELRLMVRMNEIQGISSARTLDGTWGLKVTPDQFAGIEINWWPAKIAETALFLVDHQANQRMALELGGAPERLPISVAAKIVHDNALRVDWGDAINANASTLVFGNPPFLGHETRTEEQTADMRAAWGPGKVLSRLDFVTAWHAKALGYLASFPSARFAFVTTSSITQGDQVRLLFPAILDSGWKIRFAHRGFAWSSESTGAAAVHCVIVGFDNGLATPRLFDYDSPKSAAVEIAASRINPYLIDGDNTIVEKRKTPLSAAMTPVVFGSMPRDGGGLLIEREDLDAFLADPIAAKYVHPFVGADELIEGNKRWCLWFDGADLSGLTDSPLVKARLEAVRAMRLDSKAASTRDWAKRPYLFVQRAQPVVPYVCIPRHFSEARSYATVARLPVDAICGDSNFTATDPDGLLFAAISSSMFLAWQRMVGGRLKSDPRFSSTLVWNNFPFPSVTDSERQRLIAAGAGVLTAREDHPERSLADHYNPLAMAPNLIKAHDALDRVVDRVFGFAKTPTESMRQTRLFERYVEMVDADKLANPPKVKTARVKKAVVAAV